MLSTYENRLNKLVECLDEKLEKISLNIKHFTKK